MTKAIAALLLASCSIASAAPDHGAAERGIRARPASRRVARARKPTLPGFGAEPAPARKIETDLPGFAPDEALRDAPAALTPARSLAPLPARPMALRSSARSVFRAPQPEREWTSSGAVAEARALREAARGASASSVRGLTEALRASRVSLHQRDIPADARISLLTTNAETELSEAIYRLESSKGSAADVQAALANVSRAAADLEQAGRRLSGARR